MHKVIIINGKPQSGKNYFSELIEKISQKYDITTIDLSTVDLVKEAAKILGWDGTTKGPKERKYLSDLKDISMEYNNGPFEYIKTMIKHAQYHNKSTIIFAHCREPQEIKKLKDYYKDQSITILIKRNDHYTELSNHADKEVNNYEYEHIVVNPGNEKFKEVAIDFFQKNILNK